MATTLTKEQIKALDNMNEASRRAGGIGTILNELLTASSAAAAASVEPEAEQAKS